MNKAKKMLSFAILALVLTIGIASASAGQLYHFDKTLKKNSAWLEMEQHTMTTTANEGYVRVTNKGGTSSLAFKARGQWWDGKKWNYTKYGPTTTVTTEAIRYTVYYMQSLSSSMPVYLSVRNNTSTTATPRITGYWQFDR